MDKEFQVVHWVQCTECDDICYDLVTELEEHHKYEEGQEWGVCEECCKGVYLVGSVSDVIIASNSRKASIIWKARRNRKDKQVRLNEVKL